MNVVFLFYEGMTALDAIGPHEILCRLPNASVFRAAKHPGEIHTDSGATLIAESALSDISQADVLCIPGGGNASSLREDPEIMEWVRSMHARTLWTSSVCTGSLILGAAGILQGLRATTHWAAFDRLQHWGALPTRGRVVEDGKVITAAGVSAGIDMALILSEKIAGCAFAQSIQLGIEYDPSPPYDVGSPEKIHPDILDAVKLRLTARFERI
jgi:transcriptional regulator GlxA family with amidase domain